LSRLTSDSAPDTFPVWSPDGTRIAYVSPRTGQPDVYAQPANGGAAQLILHTPNPKGTSDWSPDGRSIMYFSVIDPANGPGLYLTSADGSQTTTTFVETRFAQVWGEFSPDGHWVAYMSDESGRWEIYVRSAAAERGGQWQVSTGGGVYARWSRAGNELYYLAPDSRMMAASFSAPSGVPQLGTPVALFLTRIVGGGVNLVGRHHQYAVAPDGRFLINVMVGAPEASPLALILNWKPGR
jgi:eukaryotic-like serine/threonine-protein kinase